MTDTEKIRRWWGWGVEEAESPSAEGLYNFLAEKIGPWPDWSLPKPDIDRLELRPVVETPSLVDALAQVVGKDYLRMDPFTRVLHAMGRSYRDLIRLRLGRIPSPPDMVVYPEDHDQVQMIIEIAARHHAAIVPFGGGSSVVGGLELDPDIRPAICLDLTRMNHVLAIDPLSLTCHAQAGIFGPDLENALNQKGFTLGHFPQSFEFSTLGGWIAARGAGHKSTRYGKIEDMVLSLRMASPIGQLQTPPAPAAATGGDLTALLIGSEGGLGVITEATVTIRPLAEREWFDAFLFPDFEAGLAAVREIMAHGLPPATMRLSDRTETAALLAEASTKKKGFLSRTLMGRLVPWYLARRGIKLDEACLFLVIGEGRRDEVKVESRSVKRICKANRGFRAGAGPAQTWQETRYAAPYLRDEMITKGLLVETLETATTWDRINTLYQTVREALDQSLNWAGTNGLVMTHLSHAYPEGANLYLTFIAPQVRGREEEQWRRAKEAATNAIIKSGGVLSHHHGIGRDHKAWIEGYWGRDLVGVFKATKQKLDPLALLNPGVVFDPEPTSPQPQAAAWPFSPEARTANFSRMQDEVFDLLVIGGGIVGCGVAWDASLRGLSVVLVEKSDFAAGTSGKSSRMIHGGLRYLKMLDLKLVRESLMERHHLMRMAPHLVRPKAHVIPIYKGEGDSRTILHLGLWGYDTLSGNKGLPPHKTLSAEDVLSMEPTISSQGLEGGLIYYDALTDDARMTLETAKAANKSGAVAANHLEVVQLNIEPEMSTARLKDNFTGREFDIRAKIVVNAAGVWADRVRTAADPGIDSFLRPAKGIHITFPIELKPIKHVVILKGADGRPLFAVPSGRVAYVGTTDTDYKGDLDSPHAEVEEVDYLIDAVNRIFTGTPLTREQVITSWSGIRPLISVGGKAGETRDVSREHEIWIESERLVNVCGGKFTTFRTMAAQTVDLVLSTLTGEAYPSTPTTSLTLCGPPNSDSATAANLPENVVTRLKSKYGPRAKTIMDLAESPWLAAVLDHDLGLIAAEVFWAVRGEMGMTLTDVLVRRLALTYTTTDCGLRLAPKIARLMASLLGWGVEETKEQIRAYQDLVGRESAFRAI